MGNQYEGIVIDINKKHDDINKSNVMSKSSHTNNFFVSSFYKILFYFGWYQRLVDSGFIRGWFHEFQEYWVYSLGGRPIRLHDFFFLYSWYRVEYQNVELDDEEDKVKFLYSWQKPENIYSVFGAVYRYALSPFQYFVYRKYLKKGTRILEYGCGVAPIISSLINDKNVDFDFTIADIPQFTFHYAKWRLKQFGVNIIDIDPNILPKFPHSYDTIFLSEVLEHLPNPDEVIQHLTKHLVSGGHLIFDYLISDCDGLDTKGGFFERKQVLEHIEKHYDIVMGKVDYDNHMGRTIARKK
ncbi:MAG: class I SAM-dependent methyltransferase [Candidatus Magasanikbacteria bacterium]|jgi:hypothetical protein|nr:class I SAM-dependent methyltransferase [Candidatus Magasanikbacteria bacterium]MBT4071558.1 class I SAM-dependent methyltransferase [Candidatus Magasanikbacteria bacterium]